MLAVYRGTVIKNLVRVTANDNAPLAGTGNKHSLVQFDVVAGAEYRVQIGSRNNAEGEISLNVFSFEPGGGLSAFMLEYADNPFNSRDYVCEVYCSGSTGLCPSAR